MPSSTDPNLGLHYGWDFRESGWKTGMDANLKKLGALVHLSVKTIQDAPPASPVNGDRYIIGTGSGDWSGKNGQIAARVTGAWEYYAPAKGWLAWNENNDTLYVYGTAWVPYKGGTTLSGRPVQIPVFDPGADVTAGDGKAYFIVPDEYDGMNLARVAATVITAGETDPTVIDIYNVTDNCDMLSTGMNIESGETSTRTSATPGTIDTDHDDVAAGDVLRIDVTSVSTTPPKGLIVELVFQ